MPKLHRATNQKQEKTWRCNQLVSVPFMWLQDKANSRRKHKTRKTVNYNKKKTKQQNKKNEQQEEQYKFIKRIRYNNQTRGKHDEQL